MPYVRPLVIGAVAVAALAGPAAPAAFATGCPPGYHEVARVNGQPICFRVSITGPPTITVITDGAPCPSGAAEYSVLATLRVCVS
jgi:hypothetical protein